MPEAELRSALIVAVPEAGVVVDAWRERTSYAKPSQGVPAHVTILFPFIPPASVDDQLVAQLVALFAGVESFSFVLRRTERFPGVLFLAPEPARPFVELTGMVHAAFPCHPPHQGAFDPIVPHLTVAEGDPGTLDRADADVAQTLPISASVEEALLLVETLPNSAAWEIRARLPLGRRRPPSPSSLRSGR
jgi:2'-5' RNA ligase